MIEDLRGGCGDMPLELHGDFTVYNNGATMQVGLWIANDGEYYDLACVAASYGPQRLAGRLLRSLADAWHNRPGSAAACTYAVFQDGSHDKADIDWAQICYRLVCRDPDDYDLLAARLALLARPGRWEIPEHNESWRLAWQRNHDAAVAIAMMGVAQ